MRPHCRLFGLVLIGSVLAHTAYATQSLIPAPYPSAVPGGQPLDPEPQEGGRPQKLLDDPYPQVTGENSQGNPPISRRHRHQRLVPSINKRKYRVDRPGNPY